MKTHICIIVIAGFLIFIGSVYNKKLIDGFHTIDSHTSFTDCQPEITMNRAIMEKYLTDSQPDSIRQATGTNGLLVSQIQVVQSTDSACAVFNTGFQSDIAEIITGTSAKKFNFTYYKVGDFYFVIMTPNPSPDPTIFIKTYSGLWIFDDNYDLIEGFSF